MKEIDERLRKIEEEVTVQGEFWREKAREIEETTKFLSTKIDKEDEIVNFLRALRWRYLRKIGAYGRATKLDSTKIDSD